MPNIPCLSGSTCPEGQLSWSEVSLKFEEICNASDTERRLLVVFLGGTQLTDQERIVLSKAFNIPSAFWSRLCQDATSFFWAGDDDSSCYTRAFRFLVKHNISLAARRDPSKNTYRWQKLGFVTFHNSRHSTVVLCIDLGGNARAQLKARLTEQKLTTSSMHSFSLHPAILGYIVEQFDHAVWSWRDAVRAIEQARRPKGHTVIADFDHMHELARHLIHSSETLTTAGSVIDSIVEECVSDQSDAGSPPMAGKQRELKFFASMIKSLLQRSVALEKRMNNEIALAFHTNAQHDTLFASRIAESAQRDGRVTKGISILGMLFLPGTYVSALFSMSFFHYVPGEGEQEEQWAVSPEFWLYWVVSIPATLLTIGMWMLFERRQTSSRLQETSR